VNEEGEGKASRSSKLGGILTASKMRGGGEKRIKLFYDIESREFQRSDAPPRSNLKNDSSSEDSAALR